MTTARERETSAALLATAEEQAQVAQALSVELEREREQTARLRTALSDILRSFDEEDLWPDERMGVVESRLRAALDDLGESR